ncbi:hypothetical protein LCGC14_1262100 [marine sediment metagenome]|uniref:Uncharacterized protein n=1 Tax=marine sediment metagenome TaxID=412755 RepID=A0A0F9L0B8_9ZZZZ|nr:MAG: hypothetical protein Lokiarch_10250 [Candidatus Lokiarchaeum sp. GC14_75]
MLTDELEELNYHLQEYSERQGFGFNINISKRFEREQNKIIFFFLDQF